MSRKANPAMSGNSAPTKEPASGRTRRVLLVGSYFPRRCGIATHVAQAEMALKAEGYQVHVLSPRDCDGTFKVNLRGGLRILHLLAYAGRYERINLHFEFSDYFYLGHSPLRALNLIPLVGFFILFGRLKELNVVVHEAPPARYWFQRTLLQRLVWRRVPLITFFTQTEAEIFQGLYLLVFKAHQVRIEDVTHFYQRHCTIGQAGTRRQRAINPDKVTFLCTGFIHANKGFDRVVAIFAEEKFENCQLYIVGSVRLETDNESRQHLAELLEKCAKCRNVHLLERYLSDQELDEWIVAADYVVVPYRRSANSGVLGRAKIYDRPVIAADVGGLREQMGERDLLFEDDGNLRHLLLKIDRDWKTMKEGDGGEKLHP